jgi:iron complex outermembrane receptor protein
MRKNRIASAVFVVSSLLATAAVQAQEIYLEEVVVSAQKRDENIQDVPITLNAFTGDFINQSGARHIGDLEIYTPGLEIDTASTTQPRYYIRGIGTDDFGVGTDPSVGIYVDGVYVARSGAALTFFSDVERVEVLKGPQGTLFGRNAAAGAINVITKKPHELTEGSLLLRAGNYNKQLAEGVFNTAVTDTVFIRLNAQYNDRDGFIDNEAGGPDLGTEGNKSGRASVLWQISDTAELLWTSDYDDTDHDAPHAISTNPGLAPAYGNVFGDVANDVLESTETRILEGHTAKYTQEGEELSFTSITSYREFRTRNREDEDGTADITRYLDTDNRESNYQFYQELRLNGDTDSFEWVAGLSYFDEKAHAAQNPNSNWASILRVLTQDEPPQPYDLTPVYGLVSNIGDYQSYAVFGDIKYLINDEWAVTVGTRVTRDEKDFTWIKDDPLGLVDDNAPDGGRYSATDSWTNVSPRFVVDYKPAEELMFYGTLSSGYKAGGFNSAQITYRCRPTDASDCVNVDSSFDPEDVINAELGVKSTWLDNRLRVNGSIFKYEYQDRQFLDFVQGTGNFRSYVTLNGDVVGEGIELDATYQATANLMLTLNGGLTSVKWKDYVTADGTDLDGQAVREPLHRYALGIDYDIPSASIGTFVFHLDYSYTSPERKNDDTRDDYEPFGIDVEGFGEAKEFANARISWLEAEGRFEVALWCDNLFDKEYINRYTDLAGEGVFDSLAVTREDPRFYGIDVKYNYF